MFSCEINYLKSTNTFNQLENDKKNARWKNDPPNRACPRFPLDMRPKNKNRPFGSAHVTSGRTKNARGRDARNGRWKLDTRFISWSDCDFRRGFKYWKYRTAAFNLPRDSIGFYKRRKTPANIHADVHRDDDDDDHAERLSSGSLCRKNVFSSIPFWNGAR